MVQNKTYKKNYVHSPPCIDRISLIQFVPATIVLVSKGEEHVLKYPTSFMHKTLCQCQCQELTVVQLNRGFHLVLRFDTNACEYINQNSSIVRNEGGRVGEKV